MNDDRNTVWSLIDKHHQRLLTEWLACHERDMRLAEAARKADTEGLARRFLEELRRAAVTAQCEDIQAAEWHLMRELLETGEIAELAELERELSPDLVGLGRYLGLTENGSAGNSVFLRAWDDYEQITIKLTGHRTSGVGRTNLRAASPEALERRVKEIEASGRGVGWADGDPGYGPTYVFTDPDGHEFGP